MSTDAYREFRARVHARVCEPARSCTCPTDYDETTLDDARRRAEHGHVRYSHPGPLVACQSPDDVICKAVWP